MPKVDRLPNLQPDYTKRRFGESIARADFINQYDAVKVRIISAPTGAEFKRIVTEFLGITWADVPKTHYSKEERDTTTRDLLKGELLPTALETINIVWQVSGLDLNDVTHLIRHRLFSFAAQVSGDRDPRHDEVVVKAAVMADGEFFLRYKSIVEDARALYVDMVDSGKVNALDARPILPRCFDHTYNVRCNIKDLMGYVQQRRDVQIQPQVDNLVALKLWYEVVKLYPFIKSCIDLDAPDMFYVKTCKAGKRNIFPPAPRNDLFDWVPEQFYHDKGRDDYAGSEKFTRIHDGLIAAIKAIEED